MSDTMKMEDPAYGSAFVKKPGHSWSQAHMNREFHVEELTPLFGKWSLTSVFPSSLSGYHYKQERGGEMSRKLHFSMKVGES
jgi:hypothetical protein